MNEILEIFAGKSVGSYQLGMTRKEIWSKHRCPINCFYKTNESKHRTDAIDLLGVHVHYDDVEKSTFIEAWTKVEYNNPVLKIEDMILNGQTMSDVSSLCELLPYTFQKNDYGFESVDAGIGFYCHNYESESSLLDGVYIMKTNNQES